MTAPDWGSPETPDEPPGPEEGERVIDAGVLSEHRARRAEAEVASLRRQLAGEDRDPQPAGAEEGSAARGAAAESALAATRTAAHRVEDLVALVSELDAQLPVLDARRRSAELAARRAEEARRAHEREAGELRAEAERGALALRAAEERASLLRAELSSAREASRAGADRERDARRIAHELVVTASTGLAQADSRLAAAEQLTRALSEDIRREAHAREAAQRETYAMRRVLEEERRELRHTEERLMRSLARASARIRQLEAGAPGFSAHAPTTRGALAAERRLAGALRWPARAPAQAVPSLLKGEARLAASLSRPAPTPRAVARPAPRGPEPARSAAPRVAPGAGWLGRALVSLAWRDRAAGGALALSLLPLHGLKTARPTDWDLRLDGADATWRVTAQPGRLAAVGPLRAPRGREADFRLETDPLALAALLAGVRPRHARRSGRLAVRGSRRRARANLKALAAGPLDLRAASRSGLWLDPGLAYLALAQAIPPSWTAGHRFVVAHHLTGAHAGTWFVSVQAAAPVAVTLQAPARPDAIVSCSDAAFLPLLAGEPAPGAEQIALRGDVRAIGLLRGWVARAQGMPA